MRRYIGFVLTFCLLLCGCTANRQAMPRGQTSGVAMQSEAAEGGGAQKEGAKAAQGEDSQSVAAKGEDTQRADAEGAARTGAEGINGIAAPQSAAPQPDLKGAPADGAEPAAGVKGAAESRVDSAENTGQDNDNAPKTKENENYVTVSISDDGGKELLPPTRVEYRGGFTVLSALKAAAEAGGVSVKIRGFGALSYVEGIGGLFEFDRGPQSGWIFSVNGEIPSKGAGAVTLNSGDMVKWQYKTEG